MRKNFFPVTSPLSFCFACASDCSRHSASNPFSFLSSLCENPLFSATTTLGGLSYSQPPSHQSSFYVSSFFFSALTNKVLFFLLRIMLPQLRLELLASFSSPMRNLFWLSGHPAMSPSLVGFTDLSPFASGVMSLRASPILAPPVRGTGVACLIFFSSFVELL